VHIRCIFERSLKLLHRRRNFGVCGFDIAVLLDGHSSLPHLWMILSDTPKVVVPLITKAGYEWHGWHAFRRGLATNLYQLAAKSSRLTGFPPELRNISPFAGLPDNRRCESSIRASCAMTGTGALPFRVFGSSAYPLQIDLGFMGATEIARVIRKRYQTNELVVDSTDFGIMGSEVQLMSPLPSTCCFG